MDLFSPLQLGRYTLKNRIVQAPMQRSRNDENRVPTGMMAEYYGQRAGMGLMITEASSVSPLSVGRPGAAAVFRPEQAQGWRRVAAAVHAKGGLLFQQLYHLGRKSDPSRMPPGETPVSASAIAAKGEVAGANGPVPFAVPRALSTDEAAEQVEAFRRAAINARDAGMDGVEIHGANGYLIMQFLCDGTNRRTDRYGSGPAERTRFLFEVVDAAIGVFGRDRVGVRLSPHFRVDGIADSDPAALFAAAAAGLDARGIAYLHLIEAVEAGVPQSPPPGGAPLGPIIRRAFRGPLVVNGAYNFATASAVIASGTADAVSFGQLIIANPDLPERFRRGAALNEPDKSTFYGGGAKGYTDYPTLQPANVAAAGED